MDNQDKNEKVRINTYITRGLVEFLDTQAEELGVNRTAMISILIKNYKDQQETIKMSTLIAEAQLLSHK